MKLSKTQLDVLWLMAEGRELGTDNEPISHNIIRLGKGGVSVNVSNATTLSLVKKGLMRGNSYSTWQLTDKGRHAISQ